MVWRITLVTLGGFKLLLESADVLARNTIILLALGAAAAADTIHLKNGRTILADSAHEVSGRLEYRVGDDTYAISSSLVDRVETFGAPVSRSDRSDVSAPTLTEGVRGTERVPDRIVHDGRVDLDVLASVEKTGIPELSAAAYFVAGSFERDRGDYDKAGLYLQRALGYDPENPALLNHYAAVLIEMHRASEAVPYAERAARASPNSPDALNMLGFAYYQSDRTAEAIRTWKKSLQLRPDPTIQAYLDRAQREKSAESEFTQTDTGHLTLHYEGRQSSPALRREILRTLEAHYDALVIDLGHSPRESISVSLYTSQAFFDVTQAPAWSAAVNDGKLRIPIEGLDSVTSELSRVLKHELAHSFINQITRGRCPQWLNEGVAQIVEPRSSRGHGRRLAQLYAGQHQLPLNTLEGNWMRFTDYEAMLAYHEALAAVEYIRDTYGMSDVQRILQRIGQGSSTETALRSTIHAGYAQLEEEIAQYLKKTYGE
jgi:tetratricopeptide (TPR) repeat protein